jgi:hypothetical protein
MYSNHGCVKKFLINIFEASGLNHISQWEHINYIFFKYRDLNRGLLILTWICWPLKFFNYFSADAFMAWRWRWRWLYTSIAMFFLKTLYPGGIRTRVYSLGGRCDVHCATLPGRTLKLFEMVDAFIIHTLPCWLEQSKFFKHIYSLYPSIH